MFLTTEEEQILDGEEGYARQLAMKIVVKLGEIFSADNLIPITAAHISGASYKTIGDAPIAFLEDLVKNGARASVKATLNPVGFDLQDYKNWSLSKTVIEKQKLIIHLYESLNIQPILSCTPYYFENLSLGDHIAFSESSACVYANSVIGARTNREGGPSALASAIIGKTANYGLHVTEMRQPKLLVEVENPPKEYAEFGMLGTYVGRLAQDNIPIFQGIQTATNNQLKYLGAGLASTGMVAMFHMLGITPEAKEIDVKEYSEKITVSQDELNNELNKLSTTDNIPDLIFIGCPHCSLQEIKEIAAYLRNKKVRTDLKLWICTSQAIKDSAQQEIEAIENSGAKVICDTCIVVAYLEQLGIKTMMTSSAKAANYTPHFCDIDSVMNTVQGCLDTATRTKLKDI
jgi:predicted aconitase